MGWRTSGAPHLDGSSQVDARFYGSVVGGLEEGSLQEQSKEQQHSQHIGVLQELFGGDEVDAEQLHLKETRIVRLTGHFSECWRLRRMIG